MSGADKAARQEADDEFEVIVDETLDSGEDEMTPVGEPAKPAKPDNDDDRGERKSDRLEADQRDDDDDDDDDGPDRRNLTAEQQRELRRERRKRSRERRKEVMSTLEQQNAQLLQRIALLERNVGQQQVQTVESRYRNAMEHVRTAEAAMKDAVERGDGGRHIEALRYRDEALAVARQLAPQVEEARRGGQQQPQQQQPMRPDPELVNRAQAWAKKNAWYSPQGTDVDSQVIRAIDNEIAAEGFDPRTSDYWDELNDRARERLPHRFKVGERKAPAIGGKGEPAHPGRKQVRISPQMRQAMEEAGVWDDPKRRNKVLADHFRLQNQTR